MEVPAMASTHDIRGMNAHLDRLKQRLSPFLYFYMMFGISLTTWE
jgi:hypothetical protein